MMIGYARVSTDDQSASLQIDALRNSGCQKVFQDLGAPGGLPSRPALGQALRALKRGDTLVVWKLDRLGRSLAHLISLITELEASGVGFRSLSEAIDTQSASGRLLFHVMGALAEFERSLISERTRAGMAAAMARGKAIGRPSKLSPAQINAACRELLQRGRKLRDVAHDLSVSPPTLKRALALMSPR